ncbi:MAG: glycosyltransferase family 4 protein [bacterium]
MKIAMIGQKGIPTLFGGIERHIEELSAKLVLQGHEVFAFCRSWYTPTAKTEHRGIRLIQTPSIHTKHLDTISHTFFSILRARSMKVEVYHIHGVGPALLAWLPRLIAPKARVIVTFHCIDRKHTKWNLFARVALRLGEYMACRFAHETITVSKTLRQYCLDAYDTETNYIPNGVNHAESGDPELLKTFGLKPNAYILFVARLVSHKRAHDLIASWKQLNETESELVKNLKLAVVGDSAFTDDYVKSLHELAHGDETIVFTGYQSGYTLNSLFEHSSIYINPSVSEGLPIATLEAMSYAKPVIVADIAENLEVIGDAGLSFNKGDVNDLAEKIQWVLEHKTEATELGKQAKKLVAGNYSWDDIARKTIKLYPKARLATI